MTREERIAAIRGIAPAVGVDQAEAILEALGLNRRRGRPKDADLDLRQFVTAWVFDRLRQASPPWALDAALARTAEITGQAKSTVQAHVAYVNSVGLEWLTDHIDRRGKLSTALRRLPTNSGF